ncbi:MAG: hypothetical protein ABJB05_02995 [Parafilimonas sp.]
MKISIFLSYPKPCFTSQQTFIDNLKNFLSDRGFAPRTIGVTDYDMDAPLKGIRRLMVECNGLITVALRRTFIEKGTGRYRTDIQDLNEASIDNKWLTSPWSQIEAAMAYQLGLPILILREYGVLDEGILEKGIIGLYMPEFNLDKNPGEYFKSLEWNDVIGRWEGHVRAVSDKKGNPPSLF